MRRRTPTKAPDLLDEPMPRPTFTRREQLAMRRLSKQRMAHRPLGFDPLELRLGLRMQFIRSLPGYVVSNPLYHRLLLDHPELDDSLGGSVWLRAVYFRNHKLVALPSARTVIQARFDAADRETQLQRSPVIPSPQGDLFKEAAS